MSMLPLLTPNRGYGIRTEVGALTTAAKRTEMHILDKESPLYHGIDPLSPTKIQDAPLDMRGASRLHIVFTNE